MTEALCSVEIPGVRARARGKVRDIFEAGDHLLLVSTDRISAFDVILPEGVPDKGRVLNQLSLFWFERLASICPHHVLESRVARYPAPFNEHRELLEGRSILVRRLEMFPVECVVRGYLVGSGWKEYQQCGSVSGVALPAGLKKADRLPEPIFTPSSKAQDGHDESINYERVERLVGVALASRLRELSLKLYSSAAQQASANGIIIADTKFEFGLHGEEVVLGDEALTPDSSRFWLAKEYRPGSTPPSYDKQYVRDYLETLSWDKKPPAPHLPAEVVERSRHKYLDIFRRLTGRELQT
ncbi:MAG: phosphoribosylaminoimidazolesuccinocarboxamide synthase [Acidobacteria bacterium]|nr:phosphoribosylaminoimidazolesuccinocarboxamide synthase [Acidobacteriota bacterium]